MYKRVVRRPPKGRQTRRPPPRLESLRCSPFMFYHGEPHPTEAEDYEGDGKIPFQDVAAAATTEADIAFTNGEIAKVIEAVVQRVEAHERLPYNDIFTREVPDNVAALRRIFIKAVPVQSTSDEPLIPKPAFRALCKETFDVQSEALIEIFMQHLDRQNTGFIPYEVLIGHFETVLNGPRKDAVADACFAVFDPLGQLVITVKMIRSLRACKPQVLAASTSGATPAMVKAMLDCFAHTFLGSETMGVEEFRPLLLSDDVLIAGFFEELLRQILVHGFNVDRRDLVKAGK